MKRTLAVFSIVTAICVAADNPAAIAARATPPRVDDFVVFDREATICADGAVWAVWAQDVRPSYYKYNKSDAVQIGLYCRLIAADGTDIVPTTKIAKSLLDESTRWPRPPVTFMPFAGPSGELYVFYRYPPEGFGNRSTGPTYVAAVDRKGRTGKVALEGRVDHGTLWTFLDQKGNLRYVCNHYATHPQYGALRFDGSRLLDLPPQGRFCASLDDTDPFAYPASTRDSVPWRPGLSWAHGTNEHAAVTLLDGETLAAVRWLPSEADSQEHAENSAVLAVYRYRAQDLVLIDSIRSVAKSIVGCEVAGVRVPRAVLLKTPNGFQFFVPFKQSTLTFALDSRAQPITGRRTEQEAGSFAGYTRGGTELLVYIKGGQGKQAAVAWYGMAQDGTVYADEVLR